jgi:hypothetical protein
VSISHNQAAIEAAIDEFENPAAWRSSKRGNVWREYDGRVLTIFRRRGRYRWAIGATEEWETQFSEESYSSEAEAITALRETLGVGEF